MSCGAAVESEGGQAEASRPCGSFPAGVPGIRADVGRRVPAQEAQIDGEQGDAAAVDGSGIVESRQRGRGGAPVAAAAEPLWRVGAVGHQHSRLAGRPRARELYLISMIDDATSRAVRALRAARLERGEHAPAVGVPGAELGRPLAFYTDKAGMFQVALKNGRERSNGRAIGANNAADADCAGVGRAEHRLDSGAFAPSQGARRAPVSNGAGPPGERHARGRVAHPGGGQCIPGGRVSALVESDLAVVPANPAEAHRPLGKEHDLAAILSHVEQRQVTNDYTVRYDGKVYQIDRRDVRTGMRKARVRVEQRLDGTFAVRFQDAMCACAVASARQREDVAQAGGPRTTAPRKPPRHQKSESDGEISVRRSGPALEAGQVSNATRLSLAQQPKTQ